MWWMVVVGGWAVQVHSVQCRVVNVMAMVVLVVVVMVVVFVVVMVLVVRPQNSAASISTLSRLVRYRLIICNRQSYKKKMKAGAIFVLCLACCGTRST